METQERVVDTKFGPKTHAGSAAAAKVPGEGPTAADGFILVVDNMIPESKEAPLDSTRARMVPVAKVPGRHKSFAIYEEPVEVWGLSIVHAHTTQPEPLLP